MQCEEKAFGQLVGSPAVRNACNGYTKDAADWNVSTFSPPAIITTSVRKRKTSAQQQHSQPRTPVPTGPGQLQGSKKEIGIGILEVLNVRSVTGDY